MADISWLNLHTQCPEKYVKYKKYKPTVSTNY